MKKWKGGDADGQQGQKEERQSGTAQSAREALEGFGATACQHRGADRIPQVTSPGMGRKPLPFALSITQPGGEINVDHNESAADRRGRSGDCVADRVRDCQKGT